MSVQLIAMAILFVIVLILGIGSAITNVRNVQRWRARRRWERQFRPWIKRD